jgi:hypothetical protein
MTHYYFIIPNEQIETMHGYENPPNVFHAVQDIQGRWVCSVNSVVEFPELFEGNAFKVVALTEADFPIPENPFIL